MTHRLRIGVADDEPIMLTYYVKRLVDMGQEVVVRAPDGDVLVQRCLAERPDLIITDVRMPKLDGIVAAERLWHEAAIPAILVSAHHDSETLGRAQRADVLAYLVKPIKQADLEAAVAIAAARIARESAVRVADPPLPDHEIATLASSRLAESGYLELEAVRCSARERVITVAGKVSSFYLKQLAQSLIGHLPGVRRVDNRLEVQSGRNRTPGRQSGTTVGKSGVR